MTPATNETFIIGAGGIGCAIGYALRAGGVEVAFVETEPDKVKWGASHGVGLEGSDTLPARFVQFEDWSPGPNDTLILCTKCYHNERVLERVPDTATVIPVQNGFDQRLRERVAIEGIASFVSECDAHRPVTRITRAGDLHIGYCEDGQSGSLPEHVDRLVAVLEQHAPFKVQRVPSVLPYKYAKLMYNAAIGPLAAAAGLDNGELLTNARARRLFFALLRENYDILRRAHIELGRIGPMHPGTANRILQLPLLARAMAGPFSRTLRGTYCSMSGDIPKGQTEIENFNGHLIELAGGVGCDLNRAVFELVTQMALERATPAMQRLDEIAA